MTSVFSGREANWTSERMTESDRSALAMPITDASTLTFPTEKRRGRAISYSREARLRSGARTSAAGVVLRDEGRKLSDLVGLKHHNVALTHPFSDGDRKARRKNEKHSRVSAISQSASHPQDEREPGKACSKCMRSAMRL